jgi:hypothetical protein
MVIGPIDRQVIGKCFFNRGRFYPLIDWAKEDNYT